MSLISSRHDHGFTVILYLLILWGGKQHLNSITYLATNKKQKTVA